MKQHLKAVLGVNVASLLRLGSAPRSFLRASRNAFAAARRTESADLYSIPEITLDDILGNRRPTISLSVTRYEDGILPTDQAVALLSLLMAERPGEVLEIGTYMGHTTKLMADNLKTAIIHTADLSEDFSSQLDPQGRLPKSDFHLIARRVVGREFRGHPCESRIVQHLCDTATWDFSKAGRPTFFFIDGSHTYEYCKSDSENCLSICGERAIFLWHDCDDGHPGVVKFLMEWRKLGRNIRRISGTPLAYWKGGSQEIHSG